MWHRRRIQCARSQFVGGLASALLERVSWRYLEPLTVAEEKAEDYKLEQEDAAEEGGQQPADGSA